MSHSGDAGQSAGLSSRQSSIFEPPGYSIFYGPDNTLLWEPMVGSAELAIALSYYFPFEKDLASKMRAAMRKFLKSQSGAKDRGERQPEFQKQITPSSATPRSSNPLPMKKILSSGRNLPPSLALGQTQTKSHSHSINEDNSDSTQCPDGKPSDPLVLASQGLRGIGSLSHAKDVDAKVANATTENSFQILSWTPESRCGGKGRRKRPYEKDEKVQVAANRGNVCEVHRRRKAKCDPNRCPNNGQNWKAVESTAEKARQSMSTPEAEPSKLTPSPRSSSTTRNWAPQDLVCPSKPSTPDHNVNRSPEPKKSLANSSFLGPPWGPGSSSLFHTLYSPIWHLPWGYDDGRSWVMSPVSKGKRRTS